MKSIANEKPENVILSRPNSMIIIIIIAIITIIVCARQIKFKDYVQKLSKPDSYFAKFIRKNMEIFLYIPVKL